MGKLNIQVTCPHCGKIVQPHTKRVRKKALLLAVFVPVLSWPAMGKLTKKVVYCPECGNLFTIQKAKAVAPKV